jgi:hypothetical protein
MVIHHLLHLGEGMVEFTLFLRESVCELGYRRLKGRNFRVLMMEHFFSLGPCRLPFLLSLGNQSLKLLIQMLFVAILVIVLL